jgi:hypothetical protein
MAPWVIRRPSSREHTLCADKTMQITKTCAGVPAPPAVVDK